jgi:hypothetical protein
LTLAVVRDLREARSPARPDELAAFETDVLAGFVLALAAAGLADVTIQFDVAHLEQPRAWFGRPLWDMDPASSPPGRAPPRGRRVPRPPRRRPAAARHLRCAGHLADHPADSGDQLGDGVLGGHRIVC